MIRPMYPGADVGSSVDITAIFAPETLLPSQHKDMHRGTAEKAGERRLMLAVLEDAIRVITTTNAGRKRLKQFFDDLDWISSDDTQHPFSFVTVCDYLDIEPTTLRARVIEQTGSIKLQKRAPVVADVRPLDERLTRCRKQEVA